MKRQFGHRAAGYTTLALTAAAVLTLPGPVPMPTATAAYQGDVVYLTGVVHDFQGTHMDFGAQTIGDTAHHAGSVALTLSPLMQPELVPNGFKVGSQWYDTAGNRIAPHMYMMGDAIQLVDAPTMDLGTSIDTWDSSIGPYGGANVGPAPGIQTGMTMPAITEPTGMGPSIGDSEPRDTVVINADIHCDNFSPRRDTTIWIDGDVTIFCEQNFALNQRTHILLRSGASLSIYAKGPIEVSRQSSINMNTFQPWRTLIYNLGNLDVEINQQSSVCAQIVSPNGGLHLAQNDQFFGTFIGTTMQLDQGSQFHADMNGLSDACGVAIADTAGSASVAGTGGIDSALTYGHWFQSVLGTNLSTNHTIELVRGADGIFEYSDDAFFPIDDRLFGNEGDDHNYNFTFMVQGDFTYHACQGQFVEFQGADDFWFFIDGHLALDLGGIRPNMPQHAPVDRFMHLVDGQTYQFRLFYAQRQNVQAGFNLRTNLDMATGALVSSSPEFD